jgi:hypothetical protein
LCGCVQRGAELAVIKSSPYAAADKLRLQVPAMPSPKA